MFDDEALDQRFKVILVNIYPPVRSPSGDAYIARHVGQWGHLWASASICVAGVDAGRVCQPVGVFDGVLEATEVASPH